MREVADIQELATLAGQEIGVGEWIQITQERINQFADATNDHQWIHVDVERCRRESPFGTTIAHGFLTLVDDTETIYFVDEFYSPEHERCIRYNDPKFKLHWPAAPIVISDRDKSQPHFDPTWHLGA